MNCNEAKTLIHAYTDGELGLESALEIERHLEQCADCARERAALAALSAALGDPALRYAAPDALRRRVGAALAGEAAITARAPSARTPWWRLGWLVGEGEGGAIARVAIHHRPLDCALLFSARRGEHPRGVIDRSHFFRGSNSPSRT